MRAYRMRSLATIASLSLAVVLGMAGCGDDGGVTPPDSQPPTDGPTTDGPSGGETIKVSEDITTNTTWTADNTYVISRQVTLFVKNGATLTIEPGTTIKGERGSVLVISRGSKIMAEGTKEKPIVFTSAQPDGQKTKGFWGGLLVLGKAHINNNRVPNQASPGDETVFEAFGTSIEEGKFGGAEDADNSGVIKYVRIEFGGYNFVSDREFNNFTLCGVGSGTVVDYVQLHGGSDDGIELFGGTVNVKHLLVTQNEDDGFDTDNGWVGKAQFVIVQHGTPNGTTDAANGYESDDHAPVAGADAFNALPRTAPTVYNVTLIGNHDYTTGKGSFAAIFRRGTSGHYFNQLFFGFPKGIEFRDSATRTQADTSTFFIKNSIIFNTRVEPPEPCSPQPCTGDSPNDIVEEPYLTGPAPAGWANRRDVDPGLTAGATNLTAPNFRPAAGSAATMGFANPPADDPFFEQVTFVGGVGPDEASDWTQGWTAYPQPAAQ